MLNVDTYFYECLRRSSVKDAVDGRIFNPARPEIDEKEDKVPYIIIEYDGGSADNGTKDDKVAELSNATIAVTCVADDREKLARLTELVNDTITDALEQDLYYDEHDEWRFYIEYCTPAALNVEMDIKKPCCYQTLTYQCETSKR